MVVSAHFRHGLAAALAGIGFVGLVLLFATELKSFRRAVETWASDDLITRTELAASNLHETLQTGDFKRLYAFGDTCEQQQLHLTVFSRGGGVFYSSRAKDRSREDLLTAEVKTDEFTIQLARSRLLILAPFRKARLGFLLAALTGGVGMLLVFFLGYRQNLRLRELARVEQFRRDFIADISHELKTPLTGILGAVELLGDVPGMRDATATRLLSMIDREAKRLNALAQDLLDLARLERTDIPLHPIQTDLVEIAHEVIECLRPQANERKIALKTAFPPSAWVNGDPQLLTRALSNLIGNAIRHSGSPDVTLTLRQTERVLRFIVEDHGKGIPPAEAARVFERFHRIDPARTAETGGTGLGLAIVRKIALRHKGDVALEHVQPTGCRFILTLPA